MSFQIKKSIADAASISWQGLSLFLHSKKFVALESETGEIKKFRSFEDLKISGSGQFLESQLSGLIGEIREMSSASILFIDLREESHGYLDGHAIVWKEQTRIHEDRLLQNLAKKRIALCFSKGRPVYCSTDIKSEEEVVKSMGEQYMRIAITDLSHPSDEEVDRFIAFVLENKSANWVHFHCMAGKNRTPLMMALYDILLHAKDKELECFIEKHGIQKQIQDSNTSSKKKKAAIRLENNRFLKQFYAFCKEADLNETTWKDWKKQQIKNS